jgi:branched-subunit amino acid ABC-type transport system permease component
MALVLQALVSTIVLGSIFALMTIGMTLIYGTLRTLNMAHGATVMAGGFVGWITVSGLGLNPAVALPLAFVLTFLGGMAIQAVSVRPLVGRRDIDFEMITFISTFAVATILGTLALMTFGPRQKPFPPLVEGNISLYRGVGISYHSILMALIALTLLLLLALFLNRTRYGLGIVAVSQDLDAARLMGVPYRRVYSLTMGLSSGLAGIAGVLLASVFFVSPNAGDLPLLQALIVAILGGLGSVRGTVYAAFVIALVQSVVAVTIGSTWALPILYAVILVVLVVRPYGLAGKPQEARL